MLPVGATPPLSVAVSLMEVPMTALVGFACVVKTGVVIAALGRSATQALRPCVAA